MSAVTVSVSVSGPSFPPFVKCLASVLVGSVIAWGWMALGDWQGADLTWREGLFLLAVVGVIGSGYWGILTSRTRFDGSTIEQTWLWRKRVALADITQLKLIVVPGLWWLVVPRLVVRSGWGATTFHAGDAAVLAQFRRLAYGDAP